LLCQRDAGKLRTNEDIVTPETLNTQIARLTGIAPGRHPIVSCYLKLEPRDRARGKYLIKLKNRVRAVEGQLGGMALDRRGQDAVAKDLARIFRDLERPASLPGTQGIAIFASSGLDLYERVPLPAVHRSRLVVDATPLVRELLAVEDEVGRLLTVVLDRTSARVFEVTAFSSHEVLGIHAEATRGGRFHSDRHGAPGMGEHTWHNRIRNEKQRHLTTVADALFQLDRKKRVDGIMLAGTGADAASLIPYLHTYLRDRVMGTIKLNPKETTEAHVHAVTLTARADAERKSETALVEKLEDAHGTGWAVNGLKPTLAALAKGQLRTLLVNADRDAAGFRCGSGRLVLADRECGAEGKGTPVVDVIDEALEEALRQRVSVEVVHSPEAAARVDGLAGLLRFK
jgi:peptide subunit release factor 1 (eRF1)